MKLIRFLDLNKENEKIGQKINFAINQVIKKQKFILDHQIEKFETEFASYLKVKHVVGVNSGTDGLILALKALGVGPGDEVLVPTLSFVATAFAVTAVGAIPVFVDSDPETHQINPIKITEKINKKTKAIIPVHLYGSPCEITTIVKIAKKYKIFVIEDACQAHGSSLKNKKLGTFGDIGVFSFYPSKNLGAYGDAGAVCVNDSNLFYKFKMLRNYGQTKKYHHQIIGINSRMDEIQAAILRAKLPYLNRGNRQRNIVANWYDQYLLPKIKSPKILENGYSNRHLYPIEVNKRAALMDYLSNHGVQTLIHYPIPIHLQPCYKNLGYIKGSLPIAEKITSQTLSLPIYPTLLKKDVQYIAQLISRFVV